MENKQRDQVKEKIEKQMKKREDKMNKPSLILAYLKEEHKWENFVFLFLSVAVTLLGVLLLTGVLVIREDFPLLGSIPTAFAIFMVVVGGLGFLYSLWPFYKPALPEFKKITWLSAGKFIGNITRTFLFIIIFALLFLLYDAFLQGILGKIWK